MKVAESADTNKWGGLKAAALFGIILALLFWESFIPGFVHFSNDGPLGCVVNACTHVPAAIKSIWYDSNQLGGSGGSWSPSLTIFLLGLLGPVGFSKFLVPITMWIAGMCAWFFFRKRGLSSSACILGGLATALNSTFVSNACWGIGPHVIACGMSFIALALVSANKNTTPALIRWARIVLAGLAVGMGVMEGLDIGALFSIMVAGYVVCDSLSQSGPAASRLGNGIVQVAIIAVFAVLIASQSMIMLVGTYVKGIAGIPQEVQAEAKGEHWYWATQWSLPKREALSTIISGLYGYRMDTPKHMEMFEEDFDGGSYWGAVGRDPRLDPLFANGAPASIPPGVDGSMRFIGGGFYIGVPVVLIAIWAALQSMRRNNSVFTLEQRMFLWFSIGVAVVSLLLSFGRFAPFYQFAYRLPFFSTIRNPIKFMYLMNFAVLVLFGYGIDGLYRRYLAAGSGNKSAVTKGQDSDPFDKRWILGCIGALVLSVVGWIWYSSSEAALEHYLQVVQPGFSGPMISSMASFSIREVGWFVFFLLAAVVLVALIVKGVFAGERAKWAGVLIGLLVVIDLGKANLPYMIYWNYPDKYATNPIIDRLRKNPYEGRVAFLPRWFEMLKAPPEVLRAESLLGGLYQIEWAQHGFIYYNIQSLDVVMQPRMPQDLAAFESTFQFDPRAPQTVHLVTRRWELTNTRYLLGATGFLDWLNQALDPVQRRFRIVMRFNIVPKPGLTQATYPDELTAVLDPNGDSALFEFTGALPRAKLYTQWQTSTNDQQTLETLASPQFNPQEKVLVAEAIPAPSTTNATSQGTVDYTSYAPKKFVMQAKAEAPSVLLVNDRFDPNWKVWVDGKPAPLLRCNFIMRGVSIPAGAHSVEFRFEPSINVLYVSLASIVFGVLLVGFLAVAGRNETPPPAPEPKQPPSPPRQRGGRGEDKPFGRLADGDQRPVGCSRNVHGTLNCRER
jgi:hypothetical protein